MRVAGDAPEVSRTLARRVLRALDVGLSTQRLARLTVEATSVVDSRTAVIRSEDHAAGLILMTCYPFDAVVPGGPLRYVVTARADGDGSARRKPSRGWGPAG